MVPNPDGRPIPVLTLAGDSPAIGAGIGEEMREPIQTALAVAAEELSRDGIDLDALRVTLDPFIAAAEDKYPWLVDLLRSQATAAGVEFDLLFHLNAGAYRPSRVASPEPPEDRCTSVASRGSEGWVLGHTEDGAPESLAELYLLDATLTRATEDGTRRTRFLALNYVYTLPGVAADVNQHGLAAVLNALPDAGPSAGVPRDFVCAALLEMQTLDEAAAHLAETRQFGSWSCIVAQGPAAFAAEVNSGGVSLTALDKEPVVALTNHFCDSGMAGGGTSPRPDSLARLDRARELVRPALTTDQMQRLLADRSGYPNSISRDRTIGGFVADTASLKVWVCSGEPGTGPWTEHSLA
jgi:isopenicillin-N N-acyltransferase like protein